MTTLDLSELRRKAEAAKAKKGLAQDWWFGQKEIEDLLFATDEDAAYIHSMPPEVILRLVRIAEAAQTIILYEDNGCNEHWLHWDEHFSALRDALEGVKL